MKTRLLFLCTGNSCRSQMAEAWARHLLPPHVEVYSAGIVAHGMNPNVAEVMEEVGLSLQSHYSKTLEELRDQHFDLVITVCDNAAESCPAWPQATEVIHHPFPDPPKLAATAKTRDETLEAYRQVRDQIQVWIARQLLSHFVAHPHTA